MPRIVATIVAIAIVTVAAMLLSGGDDPELSPQDQATPTATATPTRTTTAADGDGVLGIRIADDGLDIEPLTVTRLGRTLLLSYDNATAADIEVILARGAPTGRAAIQQALVTGAVIGAGEQQRDGVQVEPGSYTVLIRTPQKDTAPIDAVSIQVR
jgi:hypothetical protein